HTPLQPPLQLFSWIHFCHTVSNNALYTLYVNGKKVLDIQYAEELQPLNMSGLLIIGQDQDFYGGGYDKTQGIRGYITQFNIWENNLQPTEIENISSGDLIMYG
ncbi:unnamed protein product, partial [Meganyctiphanes norvegica]